MSRTVLRASFRSRAIALIFRFCTKYARRTLAIVSTVTIPLLTPGANHALGAGFPPGGGVKIGRRSPPKRGQNCTPLNSSPELFGGGYGRGLVGMSEHKNGLNAASHDWAKRVRNYREKNGLSPAEFARKAKLGYSTVWAIDGAS